MGISINDAIHDTEVIKEYLGYRDEPRSEGLGVLIDIARKYQKIEHILDKWINEDSVGMSDYWMGKIKEVLEDGNKDC